MPFLGQNPMMTSGGVNEYECFSGFNRQHKGLLKISQYIYMLVCIFNGVISLFLDAAMLTSEVFGISDVPNSVCLQDRVVYTCTVPDVLVWTVGGVQLGAYITGQASGVVGTTQNDPRLSGVEANLTDVSGTTLTSTLTISSAGMIMNGSLIRCDGLLGESNSTMLHHRGDTSTWVLYTG